MVRAVVAVRREGDVHGPAREQQGGALMLGDGVEDHLAAALARTWHRSLDGHRAAGPLGPGGEVECVQPLHVHRGRGGRRLLGPGHEIERAGGSVDHGGAGDPDLGDEIGAPEVDARHRHHAGGSDEGERPERGGAQTRGVERVQGVVLGGHERHVMDPLAGDGHVPGEERLRVHLAIDREGGELPEGGRGHVGGGEDGLRILPGARVVLVLGEDAVVDPGAREGHGQRASGGAVADGERRRERSGGGGGEGGGDVAARAGCQRGAAVVGLGVGAAGRDRAERERGGPPVGEEDRLRGRRPDRHVAEVELGPVERERVTRRSSPAAVTTTSTARGRRQRSQTADRSPERFAHA